MVCVEDKERHRRLQLVWDAMTVWKDLLQRRQQLMSDAHTVTRHRYKQELVKILHEWKENVHNQKRLVNAGRKVVARWTQGTLTRCFETWLEHSDGQKRLVDAGRKGLLQWKHGMSFLIFHEVLQFPHSSLLCKRRSGLFASFLLWSDVCWECATWPSSP
jgi:hypothetical protein